MNDSVKFRLTFSMTHKFLGFKRMNHVNLQNDPLAQEGFVLVIIMYVGVKLSWRKLCQFTKP